MIRGYKAYKKGLINQFGEHHEVGHTYKTDSISYEKSGFYFCPDLEDTLRFYDGFKEEIDIAIVEGSGETREFFDEYNETTSIAATELHVLSIMTREEIIEYALGLNEVRLKKFLAGFPLTEEEMQLFDQKGKFYKQLVDYFQRGDKSAFDIKPKKR